MARHNYKLCSEGEPFFYFSGTGLLGKWIRKLQKNTPLDTADDIRRPKDEEKCNTVAHQDPGQQYVA